ncbi:hypothetical protein [Paenibacillus ginsengarvi]|uniref:DUF5666 domain-containing protein n=1 Tax=Paenibacillus ginsengarvi TaxID=400777 RepID=A0A3B0CUA9_9BACL|nr:hypothetical protein [Paenibacillus ginsengarvi]RKN86216.1 hypothetical protein D7M11_04185 [Paenibacillus ginsengarvi]
MKKSVYKSAMSHLKTSEDFQDATYIKLMNHKERMHMELVKKRKVTGWTAGIAACAVLAVGILALNHNAPATTPSTQPADTAAAKPPSMGKVAVNIDGVISEVSADGKSFKVGSLWVTVTPETKMGIDGPTAATPSEELLQKEFKVGNIVSGFTTDDVGKGKVIATNIYNNMAPRQ